MAAISIKQKKTLVVTEPLSYEEYDDDIDLRFENKQGQPIICVPIMDKEVLKVEGCIQLDFKMKNYLSSNPMMGGSHGQFKLDVVTKEILEIFSN